MPRQWHSRPWSDRGRVDETSDGEVIPGRPRLGVAIAVPVAIGLWVGLMMRCTNACSAPRARRRLAAELSRVTPPPPQVGTEAIVTSHPPRAREAPRAATPAARVASPPDSLRGQSCTGRTESSGDSSGDGHLQLG